MATERAWTIRGVTDRTRDAVLEAAHAEGLNVGEWLDQVLAKAAAEARHPKPPAATREEVAALLGPVEETLGRLAERLAALEAKVDQRTGPTTVRTRTQGKHPRGQQLRLPDR